MADPTISQPPQAAAQQIRHRRGHLHQRLLRYTAIVLLALMILIAISVLIAWLVIRPKRLVFTVEGGSVHNFNLTHDQHLTATFGFSIISYNPNRRVSFYYDSIEVWASYDDHDIAFSAVDPFFQPHRNVTRLYVKLAAQNVSLSRSISRELRLDKSRGQVELTVLLDTRVRLKVGSWKSRDRILRIWCSPVFDLVHLSSSNNFHMKYCDLEL
ncbi:hypothetical protein I3843_13G127400 [Carya illinoinensis]|uniref:Late embryogenesis abundant protein LEA-2 subgroup domain-containing protein n=1 Tax=Carya illinoinensis TaxID=32201 RepID=A0A8T1NPE1_CARIL|nr:uncharacterized protein At1g08160-like [Carya illinoinensis]KAG6632235.1 hypothetical protein CIPAW_13G144600 [Carya illinoinensis]KAG6682486.1 hypothetical protein I3842_13G144200 [Carya illinoinensis]KAG7950670.1 hypothetical protein I3843_13G127400 [Carya illinoinensis]